MRGEEAALPPEERQRRKEEAMKPRPFKGIMEPHLKDGSLVWEHTGGVRFQNRGAEGCHPLRGYLPAARHGRNAGAEGATLHRLAQHLRAALRLRSGEPRGERPAAPQPEHLLRRVRHALRQPECQAQREAHPDGRFRAQHALAGTRRERAVRQGGHLRPSRFLFAGNACRGGVAEEACLRRSTNMVRSISTICGR